MESPTLRFAATARILTQEARRAGLRAPTFRSPPRVKGRMRTIRHHANGAATVSLVLRDRPWSAVVADMIEGFVVVNELDAARAEDVRDRLWATIDEVDLPVPLTPEGPGGEFATPVAEVSLTVVDAA